MAATKSTNYLFPNTTDYRETANVLGSVVKERRVEISERFVFELTPKAAKELAHVLFMVRESGGLPETADEILDQLVTGFDLEGISLSKV